MSDKVRAAAEATVIIWRDANTALSQQNIDLELRAEKAEAAVRRVLAYANYPYRDGELTREQYDRISDALRILIGPEIMEALAAQTLDNLNG
jgi:ABC-type enterochelin transport system ATPase subunit